MIPLKYVVGAILTFPLLPVMYLQGRRIKATIPNLPEAVGVEGTCGLAKSRTLRILIMGESTMAGVGVKRHKDGFAGALAQELVGHSGEAVYWKVHAKSGSTASSVGKELLPSVQETDWDLIVIGLGGNDTFKLNHPVRWKRQIKALIDNIRLKFGNRPVVFANMPPIRDFPAFSPLMKFTLGNLVDLLGEALEEVVEEMDNAYYASDTIAVNDWMERYKTSREIFDFFSDGVHPSQLTYQILAKQLGEFIDQRIKL